MRPQLSLSSHFNLYRLHPPSSSKSGKVGKSHALAAAVGERSIKRTFSRRPFSPFFNNAHNKLIRHRRLGHSTYFIETSLTGRAVIGIPYRNGYVRLDRSLERVASTWSRLSTRNSKCSTRSNGGQMLHFIQAWPNQTMLQMAPSPRSSYTCHNKLQTPRILIRIPAFNLPRITHTQIPRLQQ